MEVRWSVRSMGDTSLLELHPGESQNVTRSSLLATLASLTSGTGSRPIQECRSDMDK